MTDAERDTLLRTLETGMVRLSTMIEEGLLRRVQGLEEGQNQTLALIAGLQSWRTELEKERLQERSLASGEASGRRWVWAKLVAALTVAGGILAACAGALKVLWELATG